MTRETYAIGSASEEKFGYSRAVKAGGLIFVSGTSGWDPLANSISDDPVEQLHTAYARLEASLAFFGAGLGDLVQLQINLRDMKDWAVLGPLSATYTRVASPAMFTVEAKMPQDRFAIELVAVAAAPDTL
jgi:enamine deaminase RidA (YjgF/YER057c/UK114 family)